jgi:methylated-DNA-[protein]-cysteine S-methyltransferase
VRRALTAYFDGSLEALNAIPWSTGGTAFQNAVWRALIEIPAGETSTYAALAARIGRPSAIARRGRGQRLQSDRRARRPAIG